MTALRDPNRDAQLKRALPLVVAFWGWAVLAVAAAPFPPVLLAPLVGLGASIAQPRAFVATAFVELAAVGLVVWLAPNDMLGFLALGAGLVVLARLLTVVFRARSGSADR